MAPLCTAGTMQHLHMSSNPGDAAASKKIPQPRRAACCIAQGDNNEHRQSPLLLVFSMRFAALCLFSVLAACAGPGTNADPATVASFVIGKTTVSQAEAALGEPNAVSTTPDGSILLVYTAANTSARASAFTRLAGLFGGGDDTKPQNAVLHFGLDRTYQGATSEAEEK